MISFTAHKSRFVAILSHLNDSSHIDSINEQINEAKDCLEKPWKKAI